MFVKIFVAAIALLIGPSAWADDAAPAKTWTLSAIGDDPIASAAFNAMKKARPLPAWTIRGGTESPAVTVSLEGHDVYVMTACRPHDCSSERIAILYDPKKRAMCGVLSTVNPKASVERLTWLNISDRDGSIDVRTILYAALTGSLENHPDACDYK